MLSNEEIEQGILMSSHNPLSTERNSSIRDLYDMANSTPNGEAILYHCLLVAEVLLKKNMAYGDSALKPIRIFSKCDSAEQIRVRIDDKISRLTRGSEAGEDVTLDLIGYLILLRIAERNNG